MISNVGIYAADVDKDGWTDLLAVGGERPVLFKNDRGQFRQSAALPELNRSIRSALFVDYDGDGWEDLLLVSDDNEPVLLENDRGTFEHVNAGFDYEPAIPIGATTADYNQDGCADIFIIQNGRWSNRPPLGFTNVSVPLDDDNGKPNVLFEGDCTGFNRVEDGDIKGTRWSLATSFVDLTGDGWADIHVANDFNRDILYINDQNGSFSRIVLSNRTDRNGMASEIADVTGDGRPDIFTTNIYHPSLIKKDVPAGQKARADGNTLLVNQGKGTFSDRAEEFNVKQGGWGWAAVIEDFDNDMDQDLFHTTQRMNFAPQNPFTPLNEADTSLLRIKYPSYWYPLVATRNDSGFDRKRAQTVGFTDTDGRGVAELDFNRDGRLDLVVADANGTFKLYRNIGQTGSSLQVTLDGNGDTLPLGATVSVSTDTITQVREYTSNTDFLSQGTRTLHFGVGADERVDLTIEWPDGTTQTFDDIRSDQRLRITPNGELLVEETFDQ